MLPNFLVIGAMKAGTTSLRQYLAAHPQVFMSRNKELHFFTDGLYDPRRGWDSGWEKGWAWYEQQFAAAGDAVARGESSPSYTAYPFRKGVPARIAEGLPDVRLVYLLRHPLERARSEYVHKRLNGRESRPMGTALLDDPVYLDKSRYATQMEQYLAHFPRDRILAVLTEDLRDDRAATMARIFEFLGIDPNPGGLALDKEFHRSEDKEGVSKLKRLTRHLPGYTRIAHRSPAVVRRVYRTATRLRDDPRAASVPGPVVAELHQRLRPDLERLRSLVPSAIERWGL